MDKNSHDKDIIEKLLNGWTLKTIMEPDPAISSNGPAHLENLELRSIIIKDHIFSGYTLHQHLNISSTDYSICTDRILQITFFYNNVCGKRFFFLINSDLDSKNYAQGIFPISRYRKHQWVLINDFQEIFDSQKDKDKTSVSDAILNNDNMKCAFLDENNFWQICNVHIPYFLYGQGKVYFQSEPFKMIPDLFTEKWMTMTSEMGDALLHQLNHDTDILGGGAPMTSPAIHSQYLIDLDGRYSDLKRVWFEAREIKVFKRKLPPDIERIQY